MPTIQEQLEAADAANQAGNYIIAETICRELLTYELMPKERATTLLLLSESLWRRGLAKEALLYAEEALSKAREIMDKELEAKALEYMGTGYLGLSDYSKALDYYQEALALNDDINNQNSKANNLGNIAVVYGQLSDYPQSLKYLHKALTLNKELGNKSGVARNLGNIGIVYKNLSDLSQSLDYYRQSLAIEEELGNKSGIAITLGNIGILYDELLDYPRALEYLHEAIAIEEQLGNKSNIASWLGGIASIYDDLSDYPRALEYYDKAITIAEELGNKSNVASWLGNTGLVYKKILDYSKALEYYHKALLISKELGDNKGVAINLCNIAIIHSNVNHKWYNPTLAEEYLKQCSRIEEKIGSKKNMYITFKCFANLYQQEGRWQECVEYLKKYYELREEVQNEEVKKQADKFAYERKILLLEQEKERSALQASVERAERDKLALLLEQKQKELLSSALAVIRKNELLDTIRKRILEVFGSGEQLRRQLTEVAGTITSALNADQEWQVFETQFKALNGEFMEVIERRYPSLSQQEIKIAALLRTGLSTKDIAKLFLLEIRTVENHRTNIRRKLALQKQDDLIAFLKLV